MLIVWVPVVGIFVALYWYVQPSEPFENKYGPNPRELQPQGGDTA